jgi:biopolymer transport protein ExbD
MAPWVNIILLLGFVLLLEARFVLQPGVVVELPTAPFADGSRSALKAVILSLQTGTPGLREETVFFDDAHFRVKDEAQRRRLGNALAAMAGRRPGRGLVILADRRVQMGTVIQVFDMARDAGIREVTLGTRGAEPGGTQEVSRW